MSRGCELPHWLWNAEVCGLGGTGLGYWRATEPAVEESWPMETLLHMHTHTLRHTDHNPTHTHTLDRFIHASMKFHVRGSSLGIYEKRGYVPVALQIIQMHENALFKMICINLGGFKPLQKVLVTLM